MIPSITTTTKKAQLHFYYQMIYGLKKNYLCSIWEKQNSRLKLLLVLSGHTFAGGHLSWEHSHRCCCHRSQKCEPLRLLIQNKNKWAKHTLRMEGDLKTSDVAMTRRHVATKSMEAFHLNAGQMSARFRNPRQARLPDVFGWGLGKVDHRQLDS